MPHRTRPDLEIIRPDDVEPEPWANGVGVTRVLTARPAWRISLAEIEGRMPFSPFLGADRVLIPLSPGGVTLEIAGGRRPVMPFTGVEFRGEDHVVAEAGERRVSVVNIMMRRSSGRARWAIRIVDGPIDEAADALVVLDGEVVAGTTSLPPGSVVGANALTTISASAGVVALLKVAVRRRVGSRAV